MISPLSLSLSFCISLSNSEEAKSTTWLHPVSGEAVITGHRKTPGKVSPDGCQVSVLGLKRHWGCCLPPLNNKKIKINKYFDHSERKRLWHPCCVSEHTSGLLSLVMWKVKSALARATSSWTSAPLFIFIFIYFFVCGQFGEVETYLRVKPIFHTRVIKLT